MEQQIIISIGREFGSGGHEIATMIAEKYNLPIYDHNLLKEMAASSKLGADTVQELEAYDEQKKNKLLSRTVRGFSNSPAQNVAYMEFDFLEGKAKSGESFVVVGRCSETILKGNKGLIPIFVIGDMDKKVERVMRIYNLSESRAQAFVNDKDKRRKDYHNSYCKIKWGDSRNYDLTINSSRLGMEESVRIISEYIDARIRVLAEEQK